MTDKEKIKILSDALLTIKDNAGGCVVFNGESVDFDTEWCSKEAEQALKEANC